MQIDVLVPYVISAVNGPDGTFFTSDEAAWEVALVNAFWTARLKGFFVDYRFDDDTSAVVNVVDPTVEMSREVAQLIVLQAAFTAIESKILSLTTKNRAKAGPVESETQRSAAALIELLKSKRAELEDIKDDLLGQDPSLVGFADLMLTRTSTWVR